MHEKMLDFWMLKVKNLDIIFFWNLIRGSLEYLLAGSGIIFSGCSFNVRNSFVERNEEENHFSEKENYPMANIIVLGFGYKKKKYEKERCYYYCLLFISVYVNW